MNRFATIGAAIAIAAIPVAPGAAQQQSSARSASENCQEPKGFNYKICNGKRVPKGKATTEPDGRTREVIRDGNCITVKERSPAGEYKATRRCD